MSALYRAASSTMIVCYRCKYDVCVMGKLAATLVLSVVHAVLQGMPPAGRAAMAAPQVESCVHTHCEYSTVMAVESCLQLWQLPTAPSQCNSLYSARVQFYAPQYHTTCSNVLPLHIRSEYRTAARTSVLTAACSRPPAGTDRSTTPSLPSRPCCCRPHASESAVW